VLDKRDLSLDLLVRTLKRLLDEKKFEEKALKIKAMVGMEQKEGWFLLCGFLLG
jgi:hypothetical protein